jgi:acyl carrier protein
VPDFTASHAAQDGVRQQGEQPLRPPATAGDESVEVIAYLLPGLLLSPPRSSASGGHGRTIEAGVRAQHATRLPADHGLPPRASRDPGALTHRLWSVRTGPLFLLAAAIRLQKDRSMDKNSAFQTITTLIGTQFSVPVEQIRPETRLADLALDSVGLVELAALLEDEFDIDFTGAVITMDERIGDLAGRLIAAR